MLEVQTTALHWNNIALYLSHEGELCVRGVLSLTAFLLSSSRRASSVVFVGHIMGSLSSLSHAILANIPAAGDSNNKMLFSYMGIRKEHCRHGSAV